MFPGRFPNVPDPMWNFGWNPQAMGLPGQFCGGDLMNQQSQAQSQAQTQAQLAALREQNTVLNQQLASQAQSHIQHLQQLLPFHQSTFTPHPPQSTPSVPEPPIHTTGIQCILQLCRRDDAADEEHGRIQYASFCGQKPRAQHEPTSSSRSTTNSSLSTYSKSSSSTR